MSAVNRSLRSASRSLRLRSKPTALASARTVGPSSLLVSSRAATVSPLHYYNSFSTTVARMSAAPMPSEHKGYDPEIKDIASYVTKPIDSELAVSPAPISLSSLLSFLRAYTGNPTSPHMPLRRG